MYINLKDQFKGFLMRVFFVVLLPVTVVKPFHNCTKKKKKTQVYTNSRAIEECWGVGYTSFLHVQYIFTCQGFQLGLMEIAPKSKLKTLDFCC